MGGKSEKSIVDKTADTHCFSCAAQGAIPVESYIFTPVSVEFILRRRKVFFMLNLHYFFSKFLFLSNLHRCL